MRFLKNKRNRVGLLVCKSPSNTTEFLFLRNVALFCEIEFSTVESVDNVDSQLSKKVEIPSILAFGCLFDRGFQQSDC